jgi:hypothetical protein
MPFTCPVCGFPDLDLPPRSPKTGGGSDEICPSCGIQFGYDDAAGGEEESRARIYEKWRKKWIARGMVWDRESTAPPQGWNPVEQLKNIGQKV